MVTSGYMQSTPGGLAALSQGQGIEKMVREPTIPHKIAETVGYLQEAHALLDRLEGAGQGPAIPPNESLTGATAQASQMAATLVGRLKGLFGE